MQPERAREPHAGWLGVLARVTRAARAGAGDRDPYAGADLANARRMVALLLGMSLALSACFTVFSPPTQPLGDVGWVIAAAIFLAGLAGIRWLLDMRREIGFDALLAVSYAGLAQVAVLDWLAGTDHLVHTGLVVLWVASGVGPHPPRRALPYLGVAVIVALEPLLYADSAAEVSRNLLLVLAVGTATLVFMVYIRSQRVGLRANEASARQLALEDALSGLGNRRAFDEALHAEIARTRRAGSALSLALFDLDGFKDINDTLGHVEGDAYLRRFADAVKGSVRTGDRCFRWGGDELAVIFPDTPGPEAERVCVRIAAAVKAAGRDSEGSRLAASYGVTELGAEGGAPELVRDADTVLMANKERKRTSSPRFVRTSLD